MVYAGAGERRANQRCTTSVRLPETIGGGRLDVGDEHDRARRRRLLGLLHDAPHSLQLPQQVAEAAGARGVDR